jgi:hypothetical protein
MQISGRGRVNANPENPEQPYNRQAQVAPEAQRSAYPAFAMTITKLEIFTALIAICFVCFLLWGSGWLQ